MRLRNVPGAREVMIENKYVFTEPEGMKGTWKDVFGNSNPVSARSRCRSGFSVMRDRK